MANNLESRIQNIVSQAAGEIAQAVRVNIAEEVQRVVGSRSSPRRATRSAGPAPAPRGRSAGRSGRRGVSEAELKTVLEYISRTPGKRSEEIRAALGLAADVGGKILAKLREQKAVRTRGEKRSTTYYAAG